MTAVTVSELLELDHRRLDRLLGQAIESVAGGAWDQAWDAFAVFDEGIEKHIRLEEQFLFPAFEDANGGFAGPTEVMRAEHAEILRSAGTISSRIRAKRDCLEELDSLTRLLSAHNLKEEQVLYPATERILEALGQRDQLIQQMEAQREDPRFRKLAGLGHQ
jgi:iron-sulfur cluster repair protein YtfE (RIC family)